MSEESDKGVEKGALLLLALGEDEAAEVLKHLGPKEVNKLGHAMAKLKATPRDRIEEVLDDLDHATERGTAIAANEDQIRSMLVKALGDDRAANLLSRCRRRLNIDPA
ncbi:MAG: flagellar motor switch protein FliG, partial [Proteobacteria bacterium]|nr:flagellar motor switch protein FliG [Pseudomonadota bacterium]